MMNILSVFSRSAPSLPFSLGPKSINMTHPPFQAMSQLLIIQIIQQNIRLAASLTFESKPNLYRVFISTESPLRRPMTYDNHSIHTIPSICPTMN